MYIITIVTSICLASLVSVFVESNGEYQKKELIND